LNELTIRYIVTVGALIAIMTLIGIGTAHAWNSDFEDEKLKAFLILIALAIEAVSGEIVIRALMRRGEVSKKLEETHSFGIHACSADPTHCFRIKGKPMPICARHLGYYGGLFVLFISALVIIDFWIWFANILSWNYHFTIGLVLMVCVAAEGGSGKMGIWKRKRRKIRFIGGVIASVVWPFFIMAAINFFNLLT
jgi:uncharacterized membrane protein